MLLYGVAIATGPFQCTRGCGVLLEAGGVGMLGWEWGVGG